MGGRLQDAPPTDWLATYTRIQLPHIISAIQDYQQRLSNFDDTIDRLYDALDIWSCPSEAWADPDLIKWAGIFDSIERSKRDETPLSNSQRVEIDQAMANLKQRAQGTYCKICYKHALENITAYEQGRLHLGTLVNYLERLADRLQEYVSEDLYISLFDQAADLEVALAVAYERHPGGPTDEQPRSINESVTQAKQSLQSLIS